MSNGNGSIPLGDVAFYDNVLPLLEAGDYAITASQQVDSTDSAHPLSKTFPASQSFSVLAPRFVLPPEDVQSTFPPNNAIGIFDQNLPHIVLTQRVLPWERVLAPSGVPAACPWMALLLFTEDEIIPPADVPTTIANPTLAGTYPVKQPVPPADSLLHPADSSTLGPNVTPQAEDETACRAIDLTTATFTAVTPRQSELPYLAHARQVSTADKATVIASGNGWFSAVIGNRFPATDPALNGGKRNIAHLVSLEGFAPYLVDNPAWPAGITKVRLASLASWSFACLPEGGSFKQLMLALTQDQPKGGDTLRLRLPVTNDAQPPSSAAAMAQTALQQGYAALTYETRVGDHGFAWYHGPFVPRPLAELTAGQPFASSAAATVYDPTTGTFDLSYAVAWELGRMLALSDRAYAANQMSARRALRKVVNLVRERTRSQSGAALLADANSSDPSPLKALLAPNHVSKSFVGWLAQAGADHLPKPGVDAKAPPPQSEMLSAAAAPVDGVRSLLARNDVRSLLNAEVTKAMASGPMKQVASWLGNLRLLAGVPFVNLLADARMLPAESIRFFYVDNNYLDALCDGATSVGVQTSRDAAQQQAVRATLLAGAKIHARTLRARKIGRAAPLLQASQPGDPLAGFILRSQAVSGWPGLEVKAFENADGVTGPIDIVRFDHLAADVLLVLFAKVPAWIEIDEPKEGLAFGVEDGNVVELRDLAGDDIGKVIAGKTATLADTCMRGSRVVNIDSWQGHLAQQMGSPPAWGPAAFAIEMVRAPEQMIFQNQPDAPSPAAKEVSRG